MNVYRDFIPRVQEQRPKDETHSRTGKPDFSSEENPVVVTISSGTAPTRYRSDKSKNNSYT